MDIREAIAEAIMGQDPQEKTPVCILRDNPEINQKFRKYGSDMKGFEESLNKLRKETEEFKDGWWDSFTKFLFQEGFINEKELKEDIGLSVQNGVLYKFSREPDRHVKPVKEKRDDS